MAKTDPKVVARQKRIKRIRKKITGTSEKPRMRVYKSAKHFYAQVIDDVSDRQVRRGGDCRGRHQRKMRPGQ